MPGPNTNTNSTQLLLHEKMSAWLGCSAVRVLLYLAANCLTKLMDSKVDYYYYMMSNTESCVAALLETRVLVLKDLITASKEGSGELNLTKIPRLAPLLSVSMEESTGRISSCEKIWLQLCKQHCGLQVTLMES